MEFLIIELLIHILQYLIYFAPFLAFVGQDGTPDGGEGLGTTVSPYLIYTNVQFNDMRNEAAEYRMENNIDLTFDTQDPSGAFYNGGSGMAYMYTFGGSAGLVLDMNGFDVIGMKIANGGDRTGLFPRLDAVIRNGRWVDCIIESTGARVGIIYGEKRNTSFIEKVGIINPTVSGVAQVGTIGGNDNSTTGIQDSYVLSGSVSADESGSVTGFSTKNADAQFTRCWVSVQVLGTSIEKHGFSNLSNNITDCFWNTDVGHASSTGGSGRTTVQLQTLSNYTPAYDMIDESNHDGLEATALWVIDDGLDYPQLYYEYNVVVISDEISGTVTHNQIAVAGAEVVLLADVEQTAESIETGDGTTVNFSGSLANTPIIPETVSITDTVEIFTDNGNGTLTGNQTGSGTINYRTGAYNITFNTAPINTQAINADYTYRSVYEVALTDVNGEYIFTGLPDGTYHVAGGWNDNGTFYRALYNPFIVISST